MALGSKITIHKRAGCPRSGELSAGLSTYGFTSHKHMQVTNKSLVGRQFITPRIDQMRQGYPSLSSVLCSSHFLRFSPVPFQTRSRHITKRKIKACYRRSIRRQQLQDPQSFPDTVSLPCYMTGVVAPPAWTAIIELTRPRDLSVDKNTFFLPTKRVCR